MKKQNQMLKPESNSLLELSDRQKVMISNTPTIPNSIKLIEWCNSDNEDKQAQFLMLSKSWKTGMAVHEHRASLGTIFNFNDEAGKVQLVVAIQKLVTTLSNWFGKKSSITEEQSFDLAMIIIDEFKTFSFEDVAVFVNKAKLGRYGKSFGEFDNETIISWLRSYDEDMTSERVKYHNKLRSQRANQTDHAIISRNILKNKDPKFKPTGTSVKATKEEKELEYKKFKEKYIKSNLLKK